MPRLLAARALLLASLPVVAQAWTEPARGTPERRALMDAIRPEAERLFGAPVEFVVRERRVSDNVAFASVSAQRPGGGAIDIRSTPGWRAGYFMEDADWFGGQALLVRSGGAWVPQDMGLGATDVWGADPALCATFRAVIPDYC